MSEFLKELQRLPVTKGTAYRNVDRKASEQIAKEDPGITAIILLR